MATKKAPTKSSKAKPMRGWELFSQAATSNQRDKLPTLEAVAAICKKGQLPEDAKFIQLMQVRMWMEPYAYYLVQAHIDSGPKPIQVAAAAGEVEEACNTLLELMKTMDYRTRRELDLPRMFWRDQWVPSPPVVIQEVLSLRDKAQAVRVACESEPSPRRPRRDDLRVMVKHLKAFFQDEIEKYHPGATRVWPTRIVRDMVFLALDSAGFNLPGKDTREKKKLLMQDYFPK